MTPRAITILTLSFIVRSSSRESRLQCLTSGNKYPTALFPLEDFFKNLRLFKLLCLKEIYMRYFDILMFGLEYNGTQRKNIDALRRDVLLCIRRTEN